MRPIKVKICGIRNKSAALTATKAGADFLGFNFVPSSKRKVTVKQAKEIINQLPVKRPQVVGVFQNQSAEAIKKVLKVVPLDLLQFHGNESSKFCQSFKMGYIKAFGVDDKSSVSDLSKQMRAYKAKYFMLDRKDRGNGPLVNLRVVKELSKKYPIILAGGLNPRNVKEIASKAGKIAGVDVAGGVEVNGSQSEVKIRGFIKQLV